MGGAFFTSNLCPERPWEGTHGEGRQYGSNSLGWVEGSVELECRVRGGGGGGARTVEGSPLLALLHLAVSVVGVGDGSTLVHGVEGEEVDLRDARAGLPPHTAPAPQATAPSSEPELRQARTPRVPEEVALVLEQGYPGPSSMGREGVGPERGK